MKGVACDILQTSDDQKRLLERAQADPEILAVIQYGSSVRGDTRVGSDIDICLIARLGERDRSMLTRK